MNRRRKAEPIVTESAPTRVCLGGEDLDWIGGPALLTAIDLPVVAAFTHRPETRTLTIRAQGALPAQLTVHEPDWFTPTSSELELARLCWQHAGHEQGGDLTIQSRAPRSAGLASSATVCVAVLRALTAYHTGNPATPDHLIGAAYHVEHDMAGRPVGPMDYVPAAFGGTTAVESKGEQIANISHLTLPPDAWFVVVDTRTPRDTGAVIAWKRRRLIQRESGIRLYTERMPTLVTEQTALLRSGGDLDALGQTLDEAQTLLCHQMQVSTPLIDTCVARLRSQGALGVKITGTGLGGCLFGLTRSREDAERLAASLNDLPVTVQVSRPAPAYRPRHANDRPRHLSSTST